MYSSFLKPPEKAILGGVFYLKNYAKITLWNGKKQQT